MTRPGTALVTGASSGIGEALAGELARRGATLIVVARSGERLHALAAEWRAQWGVTVHVLPQDLGLPGAAARVAAQVEALGLTVDVLVNNAGFGGFGPFDAQAEPEVRDMLAVNVVALTELTRVFLPGMVRRGRGRVLNVASTAAFQPGPWMAVYYATKAYVLSFSEALAEELRGTPVRVTALCPGPVATDFMNRSRLGGSRLLSGPVALGMLSAGQTARIGVNAMLRGQPVVVAGTLNAVLALTPRLLPRAAMTRVMGILQARRGPPGGQ